MFDNSEDRNAALRNWARNDRHCTAAVELLIDHDVWPARLDRVGLIHRFPAPQDDYARPDLNAALERLGRTDERELYASSSEHRILWIAASLLHGTAVSLTNVLQGLDRSNQKRVLDAFAVALGMVETLR